MVFLKVLTQKYFDIGKDGTALFTYFSEDFDFFDHQLLIPKLNACGIDTNYLYFLASYLEKREQRTKVNGSYCNFDDMLSGVPQGFTLQLLLFNIYICDLLFGIEDLDTASYADDNAPYTFSSELDVALEKLRSYTAKISE